MSMNHLTPPDGYVSAVRGQAIDDEAIPLASNISWTDTFFDGEDDVIAVFDFDYASMEDYKVKVGWALMLFPPALAVGLLSLTPCFMRKRVQWNVYSQHLCVTRDGIRFVRDKRPTYCGCSCTDAGKISKTIPFDKITDCDITEPAGATLICIKNVLSIVNVDTASSGTTKDGIVKHELSIHGLKDPHSFKKLVWAMKRSNGKMYEANITNSYISQQVDHHIKESVPLLLKEMRDEIREQTKILRGESKAHAD